MLNFLETFSSAGRWIPFPPFIRGRFTNIAECVSFIATAAAVSSILTLVVMGAARQRGFLARPSRDRWHGNPTPLGGGVAIAFAFGLVLAAGASPTKSVLGIVGAGMIMFALGLVDDFRRLSPLTKIVVQIGAALLLISTGTFVDIYFPYVAIPLSLIWFVGVTNAVNLVDNMDGLATGSCIIAAAVLVFTPPLYGNPQAPLIAAAVLGALLGFLPFNLPPARIFMGDAGSQFLGMTLAACAVAGTWRGASNLLVALAAPVLLFAVPILDLLFVSIRRQKEGRPVMEGGTDHISHSLSRAGLGSGKTLVILLAFSALFAFAAWYAQAVTSHFLAVLAITFGALVLFTAVLVFIIRRKTKQ